MKTPITDEYAECCINPDAWADLARRLESDREIFRQALIKIYTSPLTEASETILQAFRDASEFPGEIHEP